MICLCAGGVVLFGVTETNPAQRKGGVDHEVQPKGTAGAARGPLALFRKGRLLRVLTLSAVVDGMADKTHQLRAVHAQQRLGIGPSLYGVWSAGRGAMSMLLWLLQKPYPNLRGSYATKLRRPDFVDH